MDYNSLCQDLFAELEEEFTVRIDELNSYENILVSSGSSEEIKEKYRKMLIVMLYAYFEGFCKKALLIYIEYINSSNLIISQVKDGLAAATLDNEFTRLLNSNYKPVILGDNALKDDGILQIYGRQKEFISSYKELMEKKVQLAHKIIDTDSNLRSHVLKKLLYRLEMNFSIVEDNQTTLNELVNKRNSIAHGDRVRGVSKPEYLDYKNKTIELMKKLKDTIYENFYNKSYLKELPA